MVSTVSPYDQTQGPDSAPVFQLGRVTGYLGCGHGGSGAGKVSLSDFTIMKTFDKATPKLFKCDCEGHAHQDRHLTAVKAGGGGKPFLKIEFTELFVTSLQISGSSRDSDGIVSFSYNAIKIEYGPERSGQSCQHGAVTYNVKTNLTT